MGKLTTTLMGLINEYLMPGCYIDTCDDVDVWVIRINNDWEDYEFEVAGINAVEDVIKHCENFNADEYFEEVYERKLKLFTPHKILANCDYIAKKLSDLKEILESKKIRYMVALKETFDNLTYEEVGEIIDNNGLVSVLGIYKDRNELATCEAINLLGVSEHALRYFKLDEYADDLLETDNYYELSSGRIVAIE